MLMDRLELAHPSDTRQAALDALPVHGSLRKTAAALAGPDGKGPSKSSVHRWKQRASATTDTPAPPDTSDLPEPDTTQSAADDPVVQAEAEYIDPAGAAPEPGPTFADRLTDPTFLRALHRYLDLCATGTRPDIAWEGAKVIDPFFSLSDSEDADLRAAVERFTGAETERAIFALSEPLFVSQTASAFHFDPASTNDLLDALTAVRTDGYMAGINAGLTAHGRDPLTDVTDARTLRSIQLDAADVVNSVTKQWNSDASAAAWKQWSAIKDDPSLTTEADRKAALEAGMSDWRDGRSQWKADQWTGDNAAAGLFDGAKDFQDQNQTGTVGWIEPREGVCSACQDAIDLGDEQSPVDADTLYALDWPLHQSCEHGPVTVQIDVPPDQALWGENLGPTDGGGDAAPADASSSGDEAAA
jgi:hypothetical protein